MRRAVEAPTREDAVADILSAAQELARRIETLKGRVEQGGELKRRWRS
jgi:hypothetical protein